jgi:spermidine synthase
VRLAILSVVLFLSGISALIFETLWLRLSGLAFGNSIWAAALILSSFMGGVALGTAIAASAKFRTPPLKLYATLEIAVAVFGCTIVFTLPIVGELLRPLFQALWNHQGLLLALRILFSFVILLIPTTAMGLTLPVILEDRSLASAHFGRAIGILYGFNTLGAVVGAMIGELFLVKVFGLWGTSFFAGVLNCLAAVTAMLIAKDGKRSASPTEESPRQFRLKVDYQLPWRLLIVSFGAGFILLALEVVWFRFLRLYVASSATAFSIMLAVVLTGIGLGGVASGALAKKIRQSTLPILLIMAAVLTLGCYVFFPVPGLGEGEKNFYLESWSQIALISLALMFPVAFLSGVLFPTIAARVQETIGSRMNSVGITTLFNTFGAAIGPILAGFVLLPRFGFQTSLILCAIVYAILCLISGRLRASRAGRLFFLALSVFVAFTLAFFPKHRDELHFANARKLYESENQHLVKKIEGETGTWQLLRRDLFGLPYYYRLMTDGFSMSATNPRNQRYMRLFAYLPLTLRPQSQNALLIAFGCGVTADALAQDIELQHIDAVDISKEAFALADDYRSAGYTNALLDPRVRAIVQDGRFFLQASPQRYDLITGEPPPPKVLGSVNLYTAEFFKLMKDRLTDGGIATFWLPVYQLNVAEAKSILRAFHDAFENAIIWSSADEEWIMMGIRGLPRKIDNRQLRKFWDYTNTCEDLARIGIEVPEQLAALFVMDGKEIDRITADVKPLTDFYPKRLGDVTTEDKAIHSFVADYMNPTSAARDFRSSQLIRQIFPDEVINAQLEPFFAIREVRYRAGLMETNWLAELDVHLRGSRLREPVLECLDTNSFRIALAKKSERQSDQQPNGVFEDLLADALARRNYGAAIARLEEKRQLGIATPKDIYLLTYIYCLTGEVSKSESVAKDTHDRRPFVKWLWGKLQAEYGFRPPD